MCRPGDTLVTTAVSPAAVATAVTTVVTTAVTAASTSPELSTGASLSLEVSHFHLWEIEEGRHGAGPKAQ